VYRHHGIGDLLADDFGKAVRVLRLGRMTFVERQVIRRPEIFRIDETEGGGARRDYNFFTPKSSAARRRL
jgi:hypothetical protein